MGPGRALSKLAARTRILVQPTTAGHAPSLSDRDSDPELVPVQSAGGRPLGGPGQAPGRVRVRLHAATGRLDSPGSRPDLVRLHWHAPALPAAVARVSAQLRLASVWAPAAGRRPLALHKLSKQMTTPNASSCTRLLTPSFSLFPFDVS